MNSIVADILQTLDSSTILHNFIDTFRQEVILSVFDTNYNDNRDNALKCLLLNIGPNIGQNLLI